MALLFLFILQETEAVSFTRRSYRVNTTKSDELAFAEQLN